MENQMAQPTEFTLTAVMTVLARLKHPTDDITPTILVQTPWETKTILGIGGSPEEKDLIFRRLLPDFILL
jgi:hypothetical protein